MKSDPSNISMQPLKEEIKGYSLAKFKSDLIAGLQVALLAIPQSMAAAIVAGLPVTAGLYSSIFSGLIGALVGSSRFLVIGPGTAITLLIQFEIADILYTFYRDLSPMQKEVVTLSILAQLAFLVGIFQVLTAFFKLGRLTQFISHSVVVGYVVGVALTIGLSQLYPFLGIEKLSGLPTLYDSAIYLLNQAPHAHLPTLIVASASLAIMYFLPRFSKRLPAPLIAMMFVTVIVTCANWFVGYFSSDVIPSIVRLVGPSVTGDHLLPTWEFPPFQGFLLNELIPLAFAVSLLSTMESMCTAKGIASKTGVPTSHNQEILAVGCGNLVAGLIGALPVSTSPSRSALNVESGAQTRFACVFNAIFVALMIFLFGFFIQKIPEATLSALLLLTAFRLINIREFLLCLKTTKADSTVLIATVLAGLFFSLDVAFYTGVVISITLYLKNAAVPQLVEYALEESGDLRSLDPTKTHAQKAIRLVKVEGELFFGASEIFEKTLKALAEEDTTTKVIILQLKNARDMDATSCLALYQLNSFLRNNERYLIACGMNTQVWEAMSNSGVLHAIGKENIFLFDARHPHHYLQRALSRAKELANQPFSPPIEEPTTPLTATSTPVECVS